MAATSKWFPQPDSVELPVETVLLALGVSSFRKLMQGTALSHLRIRPRTSAIAVLMSFVRGIIRLRIVVDAKVVGTARAVGWRCSSHGGLEMVAGGPNGGVSRTWGGLGIEFY